MAIKTSTTQNNKEQRQIKLIERVRNNEQKKNATVNKINLLQVDNFLYLFILLTVHYSKCQAPIRNFNEVPHSFM